MIESNEKNANRFTGFADIYESARPSVPEFPITVIKEYLGKKPDTVIDLGCGTGLSTLVWKGNCNKAIGIEPSDDMRAIADKKTSNDITFIKAFSDNTGIEDSSADVVICSQSFHWMEPISTLAEVNRILKDGGIFATVDCDWPPVTKWQAENAYMKMNKKVKDIESKMPDISNNFKKYPKEKHLENIQECGYFKYSREIVFSNTENCTADRFVNLLFSQGSFQSVLKNYPQLIKKDTDEFVSLISKIYGDMKFTVDFSYRMRIAVK